MLQETLLIDADDTLWENNIYFEQAAFRYFGLMSSLGFSFQRVRSTLNEVERRNIRLLGYGAKNFVMALKETLVMMAGPPVSADLLQSIDELAEVILNHPIELLEGVEESLGTLCQHYRTIVFTKGNREEQARKVGASGLSRFFSAVEIVPEKDERSFCEVLCRYGLRKEMTWMVGNSPKSDINPAIAVGINAIYIPHARTWELEKEAFTSPEKVTVLKSFSGLMEHFEVRRRP